MGYVSSVEVVSDASSDDKPHADFLRSGRWWWWVRKVDEK
jgi:hypothetical protein